MQNAKDVCDDKVKIKIQLDEENKSLKFYHNGKPFDVQSLTFLIEQVSTKDRGSNEVETTGKFGTGFITSHLLSEIVNVQSLIEDENGKLRKFSVKLDRSGRTIEDILKAIESSASQVRKIDEEPILGGYDSGDFNTCFTYNLDDKGIEIAKNGIADLDICLPYSMLFIDKIESVEVSHLHKVYEYVSKEVIDENISINEILIKERSMHRKRHFIKFISNDTQLAFEIDIKNNSMVKTDDNCPRLFCDFPLIGTEKFPFSGVIQSSKFNPTEPRDAVFLGNSDEPEDIKNRKIIKDAIVLFKVACQYFIIKEYEKMCYLFSMFRKYENESINKEWLNNNLINKINDIILYEKLVKTSRGSFESILQWGKDENVLFPYHSKESSREKLWLLYLELDEKYLPHKEDLEDWSKYLWKAVPKLEITTLLNYLSEKHNLQLLIDTFKNEEGAIKWLNELIGFIVEDSQWQEIIEDNNILMLNQQGEIVTFDDIQQDCVVNQEFKAIANMCRDDEIESELLDKRIMLPISLSITECTDKLLVDLILRKFEKLDDEERVAISESIITLYSKKYHEKPNKIFDFYNRIFHSLDDKKEVVWNEEELWHKSELLLIDKLVKEITECEGIEIFADTYKFEDSNQAIEWLAALVGFLEKNYDTVDRKTIAILPNQNGRLCKKEELYLDDGEIDIVLKDIFALLGNDIREKLLDVNIFLEMTRDRTKTKSDICSLIRDAIESSLKLPRNEMPWKAYQKLLVWFNQNKEDAKKYFGTIFEQKHKLYNDEEIAENIEKADALNELLVEYNVSNIEELKSIFESSSKVQFIEEKIEISSDILVEHGIINEEELDKAMKNPDFSRLFRYKSTKTPEMFEYANKIMNRAKQRIVEHLTEKLGYDIDTDSAPLDKTIFLAKKGDDEIYVIARPSDCNKVVIYYDSERDFLEDKDCELWIEDEKNGVRKLTFGKILKLTKINVIPLREI